MVKQGDVVYFKRFSSEPNRRAQEITFKSNIQGFGIMLGTIQVGTPEPAARQLLAMVGEIGFVSFDDVKEFLGDAALQTLMAKFAMKYVGSPTTPGEVVEKPVLVLPPNKGQPS